MPGVDRCIVGYSGGLEPDPTYHNIQDYTEALLIEYDPSSTTSFTSILDTWRSQHTPYPNKRQYRSVIWFLNAEQEAIAKEGYGSEKYVDIEPATRFFMAEAYHQDYVKKLSRSRVY